MAACEPGPASRTAVGGSPRPDAGGLGALSTGTFNREFYIRYGMNPRCIWPGVCPADTDLFEAACVSNGHSVGNPGLRIGFAGKLIASKGVDELLLRVRCCHVIKRGH